MKKDYNLEKINADWLKNLPELPSIQDEILRKFSSDIEDKKRGIILAKLEEKGIELDIAKESVSRFKKLSVSYQGNKEIIYYNDGSPNGLRVVTFKTEISPINHEERSASITANTIYY